MIWWEGGTWSWREIAPVCNRHEAVQLALVVAAGGDGADELVDGVGGQTPGGVVVEDHVHAGDEVEDVLFLVAGPGREHDRCAAGVYRRLCEEERRHAAEGAARMKRQPRRSKKTPTRQQVRAFIKELYLARQR